MLYSKYHIDMLVEILLYYLVSNGLKETKFKFLVAYSDKVSLILEPKTNEATELIKRV